MNQVNDEETTFDVEFDHDGFIDQVEVAIEQMRADADFPMVHSATFNPHDDGGTAVEIYIALDRDVMVPFRYEHEYIGQQAYGTKGEAVDSLLEDVSMMLENLPLLSDKVAQMESALTTFLGTLEPPTPSFTLACVTLAPVSHWMKPEVAACEANFDVLGADLGGTTVRVQIDSLDDVAATVSAHISK